MKKDILIDIKVTNKISNKISVYGQQKYTSNIGCCFAFDATTSRSPSPKFPSHPRLACQIKYTFIRIYNSNTICAATISNRFDCLTLFCLTNLRE